MNLAFEILMWMLIGLGVLALSIIWVMIVVAAVTTIMKFIKEYKKASAELEAEERGEDEGPTHYF